MFHVERGGVARSKVLPPHGSPEAATRSHEGTAPYELAQRRSLPRHWGEGAGMDSPSAVGLRVFEGMFHEERGGRSWRSEGSARETG